ncbi:hypothetical protein P691DRAFT_587377 [Macrolepiota fuliginosa MF-IS2]|uniref:Uncharacterized protein n=1 Tax=Macrolepiota fuliginosa MF-IS2 TaxID=1400762 RepID=A0A9P5XFV0_9AGAR|nr:hypothetical protein P691DRAFT_587377 [Macrolepiota fuliginosa MF-IS2]
MSIILMVPLVTIFLPLFTLTRLQIPTSNPLHPHSAKAISNSPWVSGVTQPRMVVLVLVILYFVPAKWLTRAVLGVIFVRLHCGIHVWLDVLFNLF